MTMAVPVAVAVQSSGEHGVVGRKDVGLVGGIEPLRASRRALPEVMTDHVPLIGGPHPGCDRAERDPARSQAHLGEQRRPGQLASTTTAPAATPALGGRPLISRIAAWNSRCTAPVPWLPTPGQASVTLTPPCRPGG